MEEPQDPEQLSNTQLRNHYEEACIYRFQERQVNQITPWLVDYKIALSNEILNRMED